MSKFLSILCLLCILCLLSTVFLSFPRPACASGFYPLVPTWSLVRGSKTAIRWNDPKRTEKNRAVRKRRAVQVKTLQKYGRLNFDDDEIDQISAPLIVPADLLPIYVPECEFVHPGNMLPD